MRVQQATTLKFSQLEPALREYILKIRNGDTPAELSYCKHRKLSHIVHKQGAASGIICDLCGTFWVRQAWYERSHRISKLVRVDED